MPSKDEAEAAKLEAEAAKIKAEADKIARESAEWATDAARNQREAERKSAIAKSQKEAFEAQKAQFASLLPDLSTLQVGETKTAGDQPLFGSSLALGALSAVAAEVARDVKSVAGDNYFVLVTTDADLATSDATYLEVNSGLTELDKAADALLTTDRPIAAFLLAEPGVAAASAIAGVVPSVLSLLSARRSITASPIAADDASAAISVAAALAEADAGARVLLDDFRVLTPGPLSEKIDALRTRRRDLLNRKLELSGQPESSESKLRSDLIAALVTAIDTYLTAILAVPAGAKRSPFTTAVLRESLHLGQEGPRHVLLVKGQSGAAQQLVNDRPLWWEDKFSTVATTGISYVLVDVKTGEVKKGGAKSASRALSGTIGSTFTINDVRAAQ